VLVRESYLLLFLEDMAYKPNSNLKVCVVDR
jgi:hypothetical protein